ncbi:hypothetical protein Anas_12837, partial [Armadillidium nasatum]
KYVKPLYLDQKCIYHLQLSYIPDDQEVRSALADKIPDKLPEEVPRCLSVFPEFTTISGINRISDMIKGSGRSEASLKGHKCNFLLKNFYKFS